MIKKIIYLSISLIMMLGINSCDSQTANAQKTTKETKVNEAAADTIEVYYFHFTRRCATCNAVEEVTKTTLAESYSEQEKSGKIVFKSVNLDEPDSKAAARKFQAEGQALIILSQGKRMDLTDKGFMYARNNPEKFKEELKKAIDPLI